jgi:hypothetical protein
MRLYLVSFQVYKSPDLKYLSGGQNALDAIFFIFNLGFCSEL